MNPGIYYMSGLAKEPLFVYSVRRVVSGYTGPAIQVRRIASSVSTFQDFYFDSVTGELDQDAIRSFVGVGNIGYVNLWYDQSGNGVTLGGVSAVAGREPRIVAADNTIYLKNGRPAVTFVGGLSNLVSQTFTAINADDLSIFSVYTSNNIAVNQNPFIFGSIVLPRPTNDGFDYLRYAGANRITLGVSDLLTKVYTSLSTPTSLSAWKNNVLISPSPVSITSASSVTSFRLGYQAIGGVFFNFNGAFQEILIYKGEVSTRTSITSEMMSYYNII
jgi:hypothetical protein